MQRHLTAQIRRHARCDGLSACSRANLGAIVGRFGPQIGPEIELAWVHRGRCRFSGPHAPLCAISDPKRQAAGARKESTRTWHFPPGSLGQRYRAGFVQTTLGSPPDVALAESLGAKQVEQFVAAMQSMIGGRSDRLELMGAYVRAVSACGTSPFRLPDLASASSAMSGVSVKRFRNLLDDAAWDEVALRRAIVATVPMNAIEAFVLEYAPITIDLEGPTGFDVFSITAVGEGFAVPLGWRRARVPPCDPPPGSPVRDLSEEEHRCVSELLTDLGDDYVAVGGMLPSGVPPVIALDERFGENADLRADWTQNVPEYFLVVSSGYTDVQLAAEADELRRPGAVLAAQFGDWPEDAPPPPPKQVLTGGGRRGAEYAVAYRSKGRTRFGIARPKVLAARGALLGRRPQTRARALAMLASDLPQQPEAWQLKVVGFRHQSDPAWLRHALLVSAAQAALSGRLAPPSASSPSS